MARPSTWRDLSATSKAGLTAVEFRLRLPKGEITLKKLPSAPFDPTLATSNLWSVRCFALGLHDTPLTADMK